jgi:hypothetical protein
VVVEQSALVVVERFARGIGGHPVPEVIDYPVKSLRTNCEAAFDKHGFARSHDFHYCQPAFPLPAFFKQQC